MSSYIIDFLGGEIVTIFHVNSEKEALEVYKKIYHEIGDRKFKVYKTDKVSGD